MGPKVEACLRFADAGGEAVIASLTEVGPAMAGRAGTHIVPDAPARSGGKRGAGAAGEPAARATSKDAEAGQSTADKRPRHSRRGPVAGVVDSAARRRAVAE
jgi:hypothetical protein